VAGNGSHQPKVDRCGAMHHIVPEEIVMAALKEKKSSRRKLAARPQPEADMKVIGAEVTDRHSATLEYLAR
jgi:hypothetical protein